MFGVWSSKYNVQLLNLLLLSTIIIMLCTISAPAQGLRTCNIIRYFSNEGGIWHVAVLLRIQVLNSMMINLFHFLLYF